MLNSNYDITVGHRRKREFRGWLTNFILDTKNDKPWSISDVNTLHGMMNYYRMVEKDYFNNLIQKSNAKWNVDAEEMIKSYLRIA